MDEITAGAVLEMMNAVLSGDLTSIITVLPPETGFTVKETSTSSSALSLVTALPPVVVVKMLVDSLVPRVRITGALPFVEKTISILVRSTADAWAGKPRVNVMVSIPFNGSDDSP